MLHGIKNLKILTINTAANYKLVVGLSNLQNSLTIKTNYPKMHFADIVIIKNPRPTQSSDRMLIC